jgi:hypothetical protein
MTTVEEKFDLLTARSAPFDDHDGGNVAFVTNGYRDNGVVGYVTPLAEDRVFDTPAICVSAFCESTVQKPPFIARGNGGSGLTVLRPKSEMTEAELWAYAGYLSSRHRWKFSFGRMASKPRIEPLDIPASIVPVANVSPASLLPEKARTDAIGQSLRFSKMPIAKLFNIESGDFHSTEELEAGEIPLISCGDRDNGIIGFYAPPPDKTYRDTLTVAYNGDWPLMAKFHPYEFAAKDDVAVLHPREPMELPSLLFIQMLLNRETWRHSYGRKLYKVRLEKFEIGVPVNSAGDIDHSAMATWFLANPLWRHVGDALATGLQCVRQETLDLMADSGG